MWKGENVGNPPFLPLPKCFLFYPRKNAPFSPLWNLLKMLSIRTMLNYTIVMERVNTKPETIWIHTSKYLDLVWDLQTDCLKKKKTYRRTDRQTWFTKRNQSLKNSHPAGTAPVLFVRHFSIFQIRLSLSTSINGQHRPQIYSKVVLFVKHYTLTLKSPRLFPTRVFASLEVACKIYFFGN